MYAKLRMGIVQKKLGCLESEVELYEVLKCLKMRLE